MEQDFTNREIVEMFADLRKGQERIEVQTTKHNGRMTKIEERWAFLNGAMAVLSVVVIPLLAWALWTLVNIEGVIHRTVDEALSAYDIEK